MSLGSFLLILLHPHPLTVDGTWVEVSVPTDGEDVSEVHLLKVDASTLVASRGQC